MDEEVFTTDTKNEEELEIKQEVTPFSPSKKRPLEEDDQSRTIESDDDAILTNPEHYKKQRLPNVEVIEVINDIEERNIMINLTEESIDEKIEETIVENEIAISSTNEDIQYTESKENQNGTSNGSTQEINLETIKNEPDIKKDHFQISESFKEWNQKEEVLLKPRISKFAEKVLIRAKETKESEKRQREKDQMERNQQIEEKEREKYERFTEEYRREINDDRIRSYDNYKEGTYNYREDFTNTDYNYGKNYRTDDLRNSTPRRGYKQDEIIEEQSYPTKSNGKRDHIEEQSRDSLYSNTYENSPIPTTQPSNSIQLVAEELRKSFKVMASQTIVKRLSKYLEESKIQNKDDFKHLSRKITHQNFRKIKKRDNYVIKPDTPKKIKKFIDNYFARQPGGKYVRKKKDTIKNSKLPSELM